MSETGDLVKQALLFGTPLGLLGYAFKGKTGAIIGVAIGLLSIKIRVNTSKTSSVGELGVFI